MFYDCEQLRTYTLNADGEFIPVRHLARGSTCVHWINRYSGQELGANSKWGVLTVVSRDKQHVIAAGRADKAIRFTLASNRLFTCLHTDSVVRVAAGEKATTRGMFWFLDGTLDDLRTRIQSDILRSQQ